MGEASTRQIPGNWTIDAWHPTPSRPLRVVDAGVYRFMRGSWGPPAYVLVEDAVGQRYEFGFDSFLCRLFAGARNENDERAAWVVAGSPLASEFDSLARAAASEHSEWTWLAEYLDRASSWNASDHVSE